MILSSMVVQQYLSSQASASRINEECERWIGMIQRRIHLRNGTSQPGEAEGLTRYFIVPLRTLYSLASLFHFDNQSIPLLYSYEIVGTYAPGMYQV